MSRAHEPEVFASRQGCWSTCSCGWQSGTFARTLGASLAWAEHLRDLVLRRKAKR